MNLYEFLMARIAEDEERAQLLRDHAVLHLSGPFDPARVLTECKAKRRIVALHADDQPYCSDNFSNADHGFFEGPCDNLRILASVYADHSDYREEWRI